MGQASDFMYTNLITAEVNLRKLYRKVKYNEKASCSGCPQLFDRDQGHSKGSRSYSQ